MERASPELLICIGLLALVGLGIVCATVAVWIISRRPRDDDEPPDVVPFDPERRRRS